MSTRITALRRVTQNIGLLSVGFLAAVGALSLTHIGPAQAQSPGVSLAALVAKVNADEAKLTADEAKISGLQSVVEIQVFQISTLKAQTGKLDTRVVYLETHPTPGPKGDKGDKGDPGLQGLTGATGPQGPQGAAGVGFTPDKIAILDTLSLTGTELTISGVNVNIVNGLGSTETANGLGNLIVGYNEMRGGGSDNRNGSHNIVTGIFNNYTSSGGIVGGYENSLGGVAEFVVGAKNKAIGDQSCVSGGYNSMATGSQSSVSGGSNSKASGQNSSVSGGYNNTASGDYSSVSGGQSNMAIGVESSVSGGNSNTANSDQSSVSGGQSNMARAFSSSVSGGATIVEDTRFGWSGGNYHTP